MELGAQRQAVLARHKELVAKRDAINREIDENFKFFSGKAVRVESSTLRLFAFTATKQ